MDAQFTTERNFPIHQIESAPAASRPALEWYQANFGMVPHLAGVLAESPALLLSYWQTQLNLMAHSTLSRQEVNIVQMTVAHANRCQYCMAGHTAFGKTPFFGNTDEQLASARSGGVYAEPRFNALRDFTLRVLENQGRMATSHLESLFGAGYTRAQALDVVANIAAKVMSNYANQIALTPMDDAFADLAEGLPYREDRRAKSA
jgi:uncharacterized peroxidase-related enzyme